MNLVMVINTERCMGCQTCVVACHENNMLPEDFYFNKVETEGNDLYIPTKVGDTVRIKMVPQQCNHCEDPACKNNCPANAISITGAGIVAVDRNVCISCGSCVTACPFENMKLDPVYNRAAKCTLCEPRVLAGEEPFCVKSCPGRARTVGTFAELSGTILAKNGYVLQPDATIDTKPKCYYVPGA